VTTPLWCLALVALLPFALSTAGGYYRVRQLGRLDNKEPRKQAAELGGAGGRAYAAQANAWEALGFFTAVLVVLHVANPEGARSGAAAGFSLAFLATRLLHPVLYLANQDTLRSATFLVGLGCGIGLLWIAA
jgi:uncharacterized MAPEG superfamily protein